MVESCLRGYSRWHVKIDDSELNIGPFYFTGNSHCTVKNNACTNDGIFVDVFFARKMQKISTLVKYDLTTAFSSKNWPTFHHLDRVLVFLLELDTK